MSKDACMEYARELSSIVSRETSGCDCALLSGGIDTTFVVLSHSRKTRLNAITVDLGGPDVYYARLVASRLGLRHILRSPGIESFARAVDRVVEMLRIIDPVEVAADAVHLISLETAKREGCGCVLTGDGGDELFLGYNFLLGLPESKLREWLDKVIAGAWLPTVWIGRKLGLEVVAPLYSDEAKELVRRLPMECLIDRSKGYGKLLLRIFIANAGLDEVAWRRKEPVTSGSGSLRLLKQLAESSSIPEELVRDTLGFAPPSRPHLYLAWRLVSRTTPPPPCREASRRCRICSRCLDRGFCRFCGAYIEEGGVTSHYTG